MLRTRTGSALPIGVISLERKNRRVFNSYVDNAYGTKVIQYPLGGGVEGTRRALHGSSPDRQGTASCVRSLIRNFS